MSLALRKLIQLVTFDPSLILPPRSVIDRQGNRLGVFQFTKKSSQPVYVKPNLSLQGVLGEDREQGIHYIQKIKIFHLDHNKNTDTVLPDTLYDKLLIVEDRNRLETFVEKWKFSFIPREDEWEQLRKLYKKQTFQANLDFLWQKVQAMKNLARSWESGELQEDQLVWLNRELELVSPIYISYDGYAVKGLRTMKSKVTEGLDVVIGMRKAKSLRPVIGYRVYGHFALCILELLHDMESGLRVFACKHCGAFRKRKKREKREYCTRQESMKCVLERQRKRQKKSRGKPKET